MYDETLRISEEIAKHTHTHDCTYKCAQTVDLILRSIIYMKHTHLKGRQRPFMCDLISIPFSKQNHLLERSLK